MHPTGTAVCTAATRHTAIAAMVVVCAVVLAIMTTVAEAEPQAGIPCTPANGCYFNLPQWQNDLPGPDVVLTTDATGIALAREVSGPPPSDNFPLCTGLAVCRLRFWRPDAEMWLPELPNSFELRALQFSSNPPSSGMTWNDQEGSPLPTFENAVSIGDIDNWENDDFHFELLAGPPVHAFGFVLRDNGGEAGETLRLYDRTGSVMVTYDMSGSDSGPDGLFIGVISAEPILRVRFDEGSGGDDIAVADPRFGPAADVSFELLRLPADDPQRSFGQDVAIEGSQLAVAACGNGSGRVSLFHRDPADRLWRDVNPTTGLLGIAGDGEDCHGALDLEDQWLAIAGRDGPTGRVRVALALRTIATGPYQYIDLTGPQEQLGRLVDLDGARLATAGQTEGRIYEKPYPVQLPFSWVEVGQLQPLDPVPQLDALALDGDTVALGAATFDGSAGSESGAVFVFERNAGGPGAWQQVRRIESPEAEAMARFGASLALAGDRLVVGVPHHGSDDRGRVFVFSRDAGGPSNWGHVATLAPLFGETNGYFGTSVALGPADSIFVGSPGSNRPAGFNSGLVLRFDAVGPDQWSPPTELEFQHALGGEGWGAALAVDGSRLVAGSDGGFAYFDDPTGIVSDDLETGDLAFWSAVSP